MLLSAADEGERPQIENMVGKEKIDRKLLGKFMRKYEIESKVIKFSEKYRRNIEEILPSHISRFFGGICILSNN